ncbi:multidrug efflux SMR transporter [Rhodococcus fascians]|nr:multidrug efflux SMR transporter [Rhodococcus fascians]MBY3997812.1 multidrug efflux SMR transporter [Rhodococcus fascians]MBY4002805.1 multidrug efflux SMR transporter [Rhodococcus fascians]MBY4006796.1 multidrug efflux SMR transporter [Rhodococcus fascians]MBY4019403.1 multidrug efflux SMR transporter [Rhodococcus fascians]
MFAYVLLAGAIAFEIVATMSLRASEGFSNLAPSALVVVGYVCSFTLLGLALNRGLPVSVGYAIWAGLGTTIIAILGVVFFHESLSTTAIIGLVLIVSGVALLNIGGGGHGAPYAARDNTLTDQTPSSISADPAEASGSDSSASTVRP